MNTLACIRGILKGGTGLTDPQLQDIVRDLRQRARAANKSGVNMQATLSAAAQKRADVLRMEAAVNKRNAANNAVKLRETLDRRSLFRDDSSLVESVLDPSNQNVTGARDSATSKQKGYHGALAGGFIKEMTKEGLTSYIGARLVDLVDPRRWGKGPLDDKIGIELWELGTDGGTPGKTGSPEALKIAKIIHKYQELARVMQNRLGAFIQKTPGYIVRQTHDMLRISGAGFDKWRARAEATFGTDKTYENLDLTGDAAKDAAIKTKFWERLYNDLSQGEHYKAGDLSGFTGSKNIAKQQSAHRSLHPHSAEHWIAYNDEFGSSSLMEAVLGGLERAGKAAGLMDKLGTNPRQFVDDMIEALNKRARERGEKFDKRLKGYTRTLLDVVDGTADIPQNLTVAKLGSLARTWQSLAKLGGAVINSMGDTINAGASLRDDFGGNLLSRTGQVVYDEFAQIADGGARKRLAMESYVGISTLIQSLTSRITAADGVGWKWQHKISDAYFKLNLLTAHTEGADRGAAAQINAELASRQDMKFADLPPEMRSIMDRHSIGAKEWDIIREHGRHMYEGEIPLLLSDKLRDMPLKAIDPLIDWPLDAIRISAQEGYSRALKRAGQLLTKIEALKEQISKLGDYGEAVGALKGAMSEVNALLADDRAAKQWSLKMRDADPKGIFKEAIDLAKEHNSTLAPYRALLGKIRDKIALSKTAEPGVLEKLDAALHALDEQRTTLRDWPKAVERKLDARRELGIQQIENKFQSFLIDRVNAGIIKGSARGKAYATGGYQPGSTGGEGMRFIMQFKQYPMEFVQQVLGRYAQEDRFWSIPGALAKRVIADKSVAAKVASHFTMLTVLGYMALSMKDIWKGKEPRDPLDPRTWAAAALAGGGAGLYGDYLFARTNRFGGSLLESAAGPGVGAAFGGADILLSGRSAVLNDLFGDGDSNYPDVEAFNYFKNNTPFLNLFYLRAGLDYLILYDIQEALSPGSLRRMERRLKDEQGQNYLLSPVEDRMTPFTGQ